jgi:uncharacterized protein (DUF433 family)
MRLAVFQMEICTGEAGLNPLDQQCRKTYSGSMNYGGRITMEAGKRGGKPCIRRLRIAVYEVLEYLASGMSREEILKDFLIWKPKISKLVSPSPRNVSVNCLLPLLDITL